jgi:hypothetical protein
LSSVYSEQLARGHAVTGGGLVVPAGVVWVVRLITVFYPDSAGGLFHLTADDTTGTLWWDSAGPSLIGQFRYWAYLNLVMPNVTTYTIAASGTPDFSLNGYALILP